MKLKDIDVDLKAMGIESEKVSLLQMNPENPDEKKVNLCDLVLIDGCSLKKGTMKDVLIKSIKMASKQALIALVNVSDMNWLEKEDVKALLNK